MPADDGVWVYYDERLAPAGPELLQQDPEQSIRRTQTGSRPFPLEHSKLLAKGKHFEGGAGAVPDEHLNHGKARRNESTDQPL